MDTWCRSNHSEWTVFENARNRFDCLYRLLCDSTHFQLSHLWTIHTQFRATIHRHLFHVEHFNVYLCYWLIRLLHSWKVNIFIWVKMNVRCKYKMMVLIRSPHGFADTDMCSMLQQLRRESENMCGHRGLLPNSEHQTFCILAPLQLRYTPILLWM